MTIIVPDEDEVGTFAGAVSLEADLANLVDRSGSC